MSLTPKLFNLKTSKLHRNIGGLYLFLILFNLAIWVIAFLIFRNYPLLIGSSVIAYTFGLRHAVDADHIAAIDNVTRKLMQEDKKPVAVGFFFSLGHSTVVILASIIIALTATSIQKDFPQLQYLGSVAGTMVSAGFLFLIAILNIFVLRNVIHAYRKAKSGKKIGDQSLNNLLLRRGLISRILRPFYKMIGQSWHMYPLGFLFGLGFDTATEIGLLGITAVEATKGLTIWSILIFPLLFAAGMSLIDTTDGIFMLIAYGWAYVKPLRKLYYNITITSISVLVAILIGGIEVFNVVNSDLQLNGWFWNMARNLSGELGSMGYFIVGIFIVSWLVSTLIYKLKKLDRINVKQNNAGANP